MNLSLSIRLSKCFSVLWFPRVDLTDTARQIWLLTSMFSVVNKKQRWAVTLGTLSHREVKWESYESAGVVVPQGLGVAKGLQQRVGLQDDVFDVLRGDRAVSDVTTHTFHSAYTHTNTQSGGRYVSCEPSARQKHMRFKSVEQTSTPPSSYRSWVEITSWNFF